MSESKPTSAERAQGVVRFLMVEGVHGWDVAHYHLIANAIDKAVEEYKNTTSSLAIDAAVAEAVSHEVVAAQLREARAQLAETIRAALVVARDAMCHLCRGRATDGYESEATDKDGDLVHHNRAQKFFVPCTAAPIVRLIAREDEARKEGNDA